MHNHVLGIGYSDEEFADATQVWLEYGILLHRTYSIQEAVEQLQKRKFVCVAICSDDLDFSPLIRPLRDTGLTPIIMLSPQYDARKRAEILQQGAAQYILHTGSEQKAAASGKDGIRYYLGLKETEGSLTIIQQGDLMLYLEYRTVEVRGKEIDLTPLEFDMLRLLISSPKRVFLYDEIFLRLWGDEYAGNSSRTITNLVSKLRIKLKTEPDVPEHIKNVHGTGYKFDPN